MKKLIITIYTTTSTTPPPKIDSASETHAPETSSKSADEVDEELAPWVARSDVMSQIASLRRKMAGAKKGTDAERVLGDLWIEFEKWSETR